MHIKPPLAAFNSTNVGLVGAKSSRQVPLRHANRASTRNEAANDADIRVRKDRLPRFRHLGLVGPNRIIGQTALFKFSTHKEVAAVWLTEFVHEVTTFPRGKHDNQVDAPAQALDWIKKGGSVNGWIEFYKKLAENGGRITPEMLGKAPAKFVTIRAPGPYQNFYMSGTNGRAGQYSSDANGLIFNVHPEDVERLQRLGCVIVEEDSSGGTIA